MKQFDTKEIGTVGKIVITKDIEKIIDGLHNKIGPTEWSGILFYKLVKGDIKRLKNLVFEAQFLYPMNIGSHSYTEFEYDGDIMDAYDMKDGLIECSTGLIHTHHNMTTFFSPDDKEELFGNCSHYNYYLSLIVNFSKSYSCKLAIPSKVKTKNEYFFKGEDGKMVKTIRSVEQEIIVVGDLSIEFENKLEIDSWVIERIETLKKKKEAKLKQEEEKKKRSNIKTYVQKPYSSYKDWDWEDDEYYKYGNPILPIVTTRQFLTALILLDGTEDSKEIGLESAVLQLLIMEEVDPDEYDVAISNNLEVIHNAMYGSDLAFNRHCASALEELIKNEQLFGNSPYFEIIKSNLEIYAESTIV